MPGVPTSPQSNRPSVGGLPPGMGGMHQQSYTGNIGWSRGTRDLIGSGAKFAPIPAVQPDVTSGGGPMGRPKVQPNLSAPGGPLNVVGIGAPFGTTPNIAPGNGATSPFDNI